MARNSNAPKRATSKGQKSTSAGVKSKKSTARKAISRKTSTAKKTRREASTRIDTWPTPESPRGKTSRPKALSKARLEYKDWEIHPEVFVTPELKIKGTPIWKWMSTKHEGNVLYWKLWNFWVRAGVDADLRSDQFFRDYERANADSDLLLRDVGFPWRKAETEEEVWSRIGMVWDWLRDNVRYDGSEYSTISSVSDSWPSILDYARYYVDHGELVWAACFSKAHLFTTLLGRMVYPRYRFAIAEAHHTEGGAPPTATHVYAAVYVAERWFYLDPTAVYGTAFPSFADRRSIGVASFDTVDYEHPYKIIPVPLSCFEKVPYLPE